MNRIDVIDVAYEEYFQEVLRFSEISKCNNPTPVSNPIVALSSPSLTPFEGGDFILEEIEACLVRKSILPGIDDTNFDPDGDILLLEKLLNDDPSSLLPPKELNLEELRTIKSFINDPPKLELEDLPSHLEYAFLEDADKFPRKLNDATRKDHFPLPFMDQMLERLAIASWMDFPVTFKYQLTRRTKRRPPSLALMELLPTNACLSAYVMLRAHSKDA
uniref:Reverse transcriptase domain-containing protein n=1 Tax=Tanacetum cinerariifolium TaxID=118510 RepID=A0A699L3L4_TANCI|nr:reverse transcriptase domain-containing protein [Tanacetum cinerariifolium]